MKWLVDLHPYPQWHTPHLGQNVWSSIEEAQGHMGDQTRFNLVARAATCSDHFLLRVLQKMEANFCHIEYFTRQNQPNCRNSSFDRESYVLQETSYLRMIYSPKCRHRQKNRVSRSSHDMMSGIGIWGQD